MMYCCFSPFLQVAPPGMDNIQTMSCGSCSVENAFKLVFMKYMVCYV